MVEIRFECRPSSNDHNAYTVWKIVEQPNRSSKEYFYLGVKDDERLDKLREALENPVDPWEPSDEVAPHV